ncbi:hypothetical protein IIU_06105 [Bacillus cereus VD133]|uniref:Uncharacterized protein n=1 Tax=Bacillus cereus VD133 TaxID=1053233 RepID=A0A9W5PKV3_BACCE|nr:hypothetical protein [Bacillus cereus]EOO25560.1 hypothetical protein IIU_06105 [Bacillus cereus VD133]
MKFEDKRILGIQLGCLLITEKNQYLVIRKDEHYSLLDIKDTACVAFGVSIEHLDDILRKDLKERVQEIIAPEHIKIVAKNTI